MFARTNIQRAQRGAAPAGASAATQQQQQQQRKATVSPSAAAALMPRASTGGAARFPVAPAASSSTTSTTTTGAFVRQQPAVVRSQHSQQQQQQPRTASPTGGSGAADTLASGRRSSLGASSMRSKSPRFPPVRGANEPGPGTYTPDTTAQAASAGAVTSAGNVSGVGGGTTPRSGASGGATRRVFPLMAQFDNLPTTAVLGSASVSARRSSSVNSARSTASATARGRPAASAARESPQASPRDLSPLLSARVSSIAGVQIGERRSASVERRAKFSASRIEDTMKRAAELDPLHSPRSYGSSVGAASVLAGDGAGPLASARTSSPIRSPRRAVASSPTAGSSGGTGSPRRGTSSVLSPTVLSARSSSTRNASPTRAGATSPSTRASAPLRDRPASENSVVSAVLRKSASPSRAMPSAVGHAQPRTASIADGRASRLLAAILRQAETGPAEGRAFKVA